MTKKLTPLKAIRKYCMECSYTFTDVRECPITECALFQYRFGKNPKRKGVGPNPTWLKPKDTNLT